MASGMKLFGGTVFSAAFFFRSKEHKKRQDADDKLLSELQQIRDEIKQFSELHKKKNEKKFSPTEFFVAFIVIPILALSLAGIFAYIIVNFDYDYPNEYYE